MEHPLKTAACPLLFAASGGRFTPLGLPVVGGVVVLDTEDVDPDHNRAASILCDEAYDCGTCPLLRQWVATEAQQGWSIGWECSNCLKETFRRERDDPALERKLPGFYQAGRDVAPDHEDYDPDNPPLAGCTRCGWGSSFLQLVLRRQR